MNLTSGGPDMSRRHIATIAAFVVLFSVLGYLVFWLIDIWMDFGASLTGHGWAALIFGVLFSLIIAGGLTALLIFSNRRGYDEPPKFHGTDTPPKVDP
jgi:hypothetical protein